MPIECKIKSILPLKIFIDFEIKFSRSSSEVASAGITSELHFLAKSLILPNLKAVGAFVKIIFAPFSTHSSSSSWVYDSPGLKIFMGSSTGNMLVDDFSTLNNIFSKSILIFLIC